MGRMAIGERFFWLLRFGAALALAGPISAAAAPPEEPGGSPASAPSRTWIAYADIVRAEEVPGGYSMTLEIVRSPNDPEPFPIDRFEATIAIRSLPASGRLFLVLDISQPSDPRVLMWAIARQETCVPEHLIERFGIRDYFEGARVTGTGRERELCAF